VVDTLYSLVVGEADPTTRVRRFTILYSGATRLVRTLDLDQAVALLEFDLHSRIAERARNRLFVHAGVVGWGDAAIVIPGPMASGKSRLVSALVNAGGVYYSDQFAVLDSRGRVYPYPAPLVLRESADAEATPHPAESLGWKTGTKPLPVSHVLITRYQRGARWRPSVVSAGDAAMELLINTVPARQHPELALNALSQVAATATVLKGVRGEAKQLVEFLTKRDR
jgi:hypothetical protein